MKPAPYHWDEMKVGPGATPFATAEGWLHIYHGVFATMDGNIYRLGVALHDLEDPTRVRAVADEWILQPEQPYEVTGYVHNVVLDIAAPRQPLALRPNRGYDHHARRRDGLRRRGCAANKPIGDAGRESRTIPGQ